jgi:hypothetical protein
MLPPISTGWPAARKLGGKSGCPGPKARDFSGFTTSGSQITAVRATAACSNADATPGPIPHTPMSAPCEKSSQRTALSVESGLAISSIVKKIRVPAVSPLI